METYRIAMHQNGKLVTLEAILDAIDGTGLDWHLTEIQAIAARDTDLDVLRLEQEARSKPGGRVFTYADLRALSRKIDQVIDCQILGVPQESPIATGAPETVDIVAFDSTEWILRIGAVQHHRLNLHSSLFTNPR